MRECLDSLKLTLEPGHKSGLVRNINFVHVENITSFGEYSIKHRVNSIYLVQSQYVAAVQSQEAWSE